MDTNILVNDLIEEGQRIIEHLPHEGFDVTAGFWLKSAEDGQWYFYIVSPAAEPERLSGTYGRLHTLIRRLPHLLWIDPLEVRLIGPSNPIARDVLAIHSGVSGSRRSPTRWDGTRLGNISVEAAYLYPLPAEASS